MRSPLGSPRAEPLGSGHICPYIPRLVLIRMQYLLVLAGGYSGGLPNPQYCLSLNTWDCTIPYHTIPYRTIPYHIVPYSSISSHTAPFHAILTIETLYHRHHFHPILTVATSVSPVKLAEGPRKCWTIFSHLGLDPPQPPRAGPSSAT